ncbi:MAG: FAD-binding oxidoreductase, partial [Gammaproteobacteria bacterium]|nr:FAD-binding oxidoreductase [Gammaproteobacteria bacterium]
MKKKVLIIGGGIFGTQTAITLKEAGHDVVLVEQNNEILSEISGAFLLRNHEDLYYPFSPETHLNYKASSKELRETYPEIFCKHKKFIYMTGKTDAKRNLSKITAEEFKVVCAENSSSRVLEAEEIEKRGFATSELDFAVSIEESTLAGGKKLRIFFEEKLKACNVSVRCNTQVTEMKVLNDNR